MATQHTRPRKATVAVPTPRRDGFAGVRRFLTDLCLSNNGSVIVANVAAALHAHHCQASHCADFLLECGRSYSPRQGDGGREAMRVLVDTIASQHGNFFFKRALAASPDSTVSLVMSTSTLAPDAPRPDQWTIFRPEFFKQRNRLGGRSRVASTGDQVRAVIANLNRGLRYHLKPDAQIGGGPYAVFVTRSDEQWHTTVNDGGDRKADVVRDYLGLDHTSGRILVELQPRHNLQALLQMKITVAAPTFFEAWRCYLFRQVPDGSADGWGRTIDLAKLRNQDSNIDGAPEAILNGLPLSRMGGPINAVAIGQITADMPAGVEQHRDRLYANRSAVDMVDQIIADLRRQPPPAPATRTSARR